MDTEKPKAKSTSGKPETQTLEYDLYEETDTTFKPINTKPWSSSSSSSSSIDDFSEFDPMQQSSAPAPKPRKESQPQSKTTGSPVKKGQPLSEASIQAQKQMEENTKERTQSTLESHRTREAKKEELSEAKRAMAGTLQDKLNAWEMKDGVRKNISTLLQNLNKVIWADSGWKPPSLTELQDLSGIKKHYHKALIIVHPDKVSESEVERQVIAERVFEALNKAFEAYKQKN